jgi:hypothetical protein
MSTSVVILLLSAMFITFDDVFLTTESGDLLYVVP